MKHGIPDQGRAAAGGGVGAFLVALVLFAAPAAQAWGQALPLLDTHIHFAGNPRGSMDYRGAMEEALRNLGQNGFDRVIVMPPPFAAGMPAIYDIEDFRRAMQAFGKRVFLGGGGLLLNGLIHGTPPDRVTDAVKKRFRADAERVAAAGAVVFGEIALHHLSLGVMGPGHPYEWVAPDHPLLLLLADIGAEKGMPLDLHIDLVPEDMETPRRPGLSNNNPPRLKGNLQALERLLAHNRNAKIVWAHAGSDPLGTRFPDVQRGLLERHPNLYMSLRLSITAPPPFMAMDPGPMLKAEWVALLTAFPERFTLGSDSFHAPAGAPQRGPDNKLENYRAALSQLPREVAEAIAFRNAERIYRLAER